MDSGAESNFFDDGFALQTGISHEPLETPLEANALDGHLLAQIKQNSCSLSFSGNHREQLQFHLISFPSVLGHPWFQQVPLSVLCSC